MRVFLLCAFERQKNALVSAEKAAQKKNKKFLSFVFSSISKRSLLQKISAYFNRDEEGGDEEQTRKQTTNNNNNHEDVGSREGVLPLY